MKKWTARHRQVGEGFTELVWPAGTVKVDSGQAEEIIAGIRHVQKRLRIAGVGRSGSGHVETG